MKNVPAPARQRTVPVVFLMGVPVVVGIAVNVVVETLGLAGVLSSRTAWWGAWMLGALAIFFALRFLHHFLERAPDARRPLPGAPVLGAISVILAVTLLTALISPPNTYDALTYHNSRVMQWWDHGRLGFWVTPIERQLVMPPLASYFRLSLYGPTGSDLFFNAVQWLFFGYTIFGAWALGESLAPGRKAGDLAAVLVATMPMAVLQSTSSQNDLVCAGYVVAAAFFLERVLRGPASRAGPDLTLLGGAVGLALLTKGTAVAFALPLLFLGTLVALGRIFRSPTTRLVSGAGALAGVLFVVFLNVPHAARVIRAFGSSPSQSPFLVRPAAYVEGGFAAGAARALSQLTRNGVLQMGQLRLIGVRSTDLVDAVTSLHRWLETDVNDTHTTPPGARFDESRWQLLNHEDTASSTIHLLLALFSPALLLWSGSAARGLRRTWGLAFAIGWTLWALLCLSVAWMPWNQRLHLPALILLMVPTAAACSTIPRLGRAIGAVVLMASLPYLFLNYSRPLVDLARVSPEPAWRRIWTGGETGNLRSILTTPRWDDFFRNAPGYRKTVEDSLATIAAECPDGAVVGLRLGGNFPEYLLWAGARNLGRDFRFRHLGAHSESGDACVVLELAGP
jgi:hypothetical protein